MRILPRVSLVLLILIPVVFQSGCVKEPELTPKEISTFSLIKEINIDSLKANVEWLEGMGTRFALADNRKTVAAAIRDRFKRMGYADAHLDSFMITRVFRSISYTRMQYNVIATLNGSVSPDSISIIGAHYDNILRTNEGDPFIAAYGANDNASGVAATLEIARVMRKKGYDPSSTIMFIAFGAEELGLLGSIAHAGYAKQNDLKIKVMLNNDMIAYQPSTDKAKWILNIMDYDNSHFLRYRAQELTKKYTSLLYTNDNKYHRQSDSYPYFLNGYKALFFFSFASDPNYHTLRDISSELNFSFCREVTKLNCAILVDNN